MISRLGGIEFETVDTYLSSISRHHPLKYIQGKQCPWWYKDRLIFEMANNTGFFPCDKPNLDRFAKLYIDCVLEMDIVGKFRKSEIKYNKFYSPYLKSTWITNLEPFWSEIPYTSALKGKRVLVVHPFAETIKKQYEKRTLLHHHPDTLPKFSDFYVIPAVQSLGGKADGFETWFDALHYMENEIDKHDYEVCLIGCGAYGLPLAAHVKRQGKKAIHIGGALQLLFGIMGKRWIDFEPFMLDGKLIDYSTLPNKHWVTPSEAERPQNYKVVERGCYW